MTIHIGEFWFGWVTGVVSTFVGSTAVVIFLLKYAERKGEEE